MMARKMVSIWVGLMAEAMVAEMVLQLVMRLDDEWVDKMAVVKADDLVEY